MTPSTTPPRRPWTRRATSRSSVATAHEKLEGEWPVNAELKELLDTTIRDSRWDFKYLGMQIVIEGLAMAAFGSLYQICQEPLLKNLLLNVMRDESRHVAFGVLSLKGYYDDMPRARAPRS